MGPNVFQNLNFKDQTLFRTRLISMRSQPNCFEVMWLLLLSLILILLPNCFVVVVVAVVVVVIVVVVVVLNV